jgi:hypothetical protein
VPDNLLGKKVKCPSCGTAFVAEEEAPQEEPAAPVKKPARSAPPPPPPPPPEDEEEQDQEEQQQEETPDDEDQDGEETPKRKKKRRSSAGVEPGERPGKVQAIAIMILIGGILATISAAFILLYFGFMGIVSMGIGLLCCLWPGPYYGLVMGIMAIIKGAKLLGSEGHLQAPPKGTAIMQIINIINFDVPNLVMGILTLVFLNDEEVKNYYQGS